jgi:hypothetical protein
MRSSTHGSLGHRSTQERVESGGAGTARSQAPIQWHMLPIQ